MNNKLIDGKILRAMVVTGAGRLEKDKSKIDSLNVFPVPDGDTGTNMALTMASAARAVNKLDLDADLYKVAEAMSHGALMGARGNSGVILSQLLGGFAKALSEVKEMDGIILAKAFSAGVEAAYKAVVKPIEGTILTVAREAAEKLAMKVEKSWDIDTAFQIYLEQGYKTLARTPEMLPVLKQAGVVDAGGQGLLTIIEGMFAGFKGDNAEESLVQEDVSQPAKTESLFPVADYKISDDNIEFQYCTELFFKKIPTTNITIEDIRKFLEGKGDCVLVVGTEELIKIHVHTNNPGAVLEYFTELGTLHDIKIENMCEQSKELQSSSPPKAIGVIAISAGEGINEIFKSLGVDIVITGGQTMNPSTQDILSAVEEINAKEIIILPNNKNIILAAQQVVSLTKKPVKVVTTKTIPQGISALMAFNGELNMDINFAKMTEAAKNIKSCEITFAVRDTQHGEFSIKSGQIMSIIEGDISIVSDNLEEVVIKTMENMIVNNDELVTLYYGEEVKEQEAEGLLKKLADLYPQIDFELHYGGQPLYYYFISFE